MNYGSKPRPVTVDGKCITGCGTAVKFVGQLKTDYTEGLVVGKRIFLPKGTWIGTAISEGVPCSAIEVDEWFPIERL